MERTLLMVKPDGVVRGLIGEVLKRVESKGLKIVALKMLWMDRALAEKFYSVHKGKPFFNQLVEHITSAPIVATVVEGEDAVNVVRRLIGSTDPKQAPPGTIRGDLGLSLTKNVVHASDSIESAEREIGLLFSDNELLSYNRADEEWVK
ncbi:MAG: nucleoside-diphosphate kinase [Thermoprotei archaeon]|nr:MAG: nucleoside-diphosphate kinase [Thermoprotei archaeon]